MIVAAWVILYLMLGYLTVFLISLSEPPPDRGVEAIAVIAWPVVAVLVLVLVSYGLFQSHVADSVISPSKAAQRVKSRHRMLTIKSNGKDLRDT